MLPDPFVRQEEECLVLDHRPAEVRSEVISLERRLRHGDRVEEVACIQRVVPEELQSLAVIFVVPERVARLTMAPALRPYSAGNDELSILYSARCQWGLEGELVCTLSLRLMPLTSQLVVSSR